MAGIHKNPTSEYQNKFKQKNNIYIFSVVATKEN